MQPALRMGKRRGGRRIVCICQLDWMDGCVPRSARVEGGYKKGRARVQFQISKFEKKIRHLYGNLNLDEIKNALRLLSVNGETNLMNLIRL